MSNVLPEVRSSGFFKSLGPNGEQIAAQSLDEAASILQRYFPKNYQIRDRYQPGRVLVQNVNLSRLKLRYSWYASAMEIRATPDNPFYSLHFRRYGSAEYIVGRRSFITSAHSGAFMPGLQPVRVLTGPNWHTFATKFSPETLRLELSRLLDREINRPIEFNPEVNFERGAGRHIRLLLGRVFDESRNYSAGSSTLNLGLRQLEDSLISLILEGLDHNYAKFVNGPDRDIAPWQLRAVEEFIWQSADQPHTLGELAAVGGVSARSLQSVFQRRRGYSPMKFLRRVRFERVHDELLHPNHKTTVTSAAFQWGFLHLGRFAAAYHARFGEKPSETLRRSSAK
jgi:AraC-like DNA-binding protein